MITKIKTVVMSFLFFQPLAYAKTYNLVEDKIELSEEFLLSLDADQRKYLDIKLGSTYEADEEGVIWEWVNMEEIENLATNNSQQPTVEEILSE